jgi:hypothetical protein
MIMIAFLQIWQYIVMTQMGCCLSTAVPAFAEQTNAINALNQSWGKPLPNTEFAFVTLAGLTADQKQSCQFSFTQGNSSNSHNRTLAPTQALKS